jgi:hypothetical protein
MSEEEEAAEKSENLLAAIARGTTDGLHLALNIAAMLISFLALIALTNGLLGGIHNGLTHVGISWFPSSMERIFGIVFAPIAWLIGIPWHDCPVIGNLLGTRMVLNELVAFSMLGPQKGARSAIVHYRHLCPMWFRESQFHRHSDRRHRRTRPQSARRPGSPRSPRNAGWHHGQPDVCFHRGHALLTQIDLFAIFAPFATFAVEGFSKRRPALWQRPSARLPPVQTSIVRITIDH